MRLISSSEIPKDSAGFRRRGSLRLPYSPFGVLTEALFALRSVVFPILRLGASHLPREFWHSRPGSPIIITETPRVPKKPICYDKVRHVAAIHTHQSLLLSKMCHLGWDAHCIELSVRLWRFSNRPSWVKVADKRKSSQAYSRK